MNQVKDLLNLTIDNNIELEKEGTAPIAVCLEAEAGIGKTSVVQQVADERGMTCVKLSLHELEEAGDLVGFPELQYECQTARKIKNEDGTVKMQVLPGTVWMNAKQLDNPDKSIAIRQTGKTRMGYAKPAWVPEYNEKGTIFLLDDFGRCNQQLSQAVMELILTQGYVSWKLPKKTTIFLTSNPDNGDYSVNSQDPAQRDRYLAYNVAWDLDSWSKWAEKASIDGRCINFVMSYSSELFNIDGEGNRICTPRSFVMFSNMIKGIKDWDKTENLGTISLIAKGCFKDDAGRFSQMFTTFIRNKMHLLIQPKDMLEGGWDRIKEKLLETVYDQSTGQYRPDIASMLERRFSNYVGAWLDSDKKTPISVVKDRILNFIDVEETDGKRIFDPDLIYHMLKTITSDHKNQTNHLLFEPKIAKILS